MDGRSPEQQAANAKDSAHICGISRAQFFKLHSMGRVPAPVRLGSRAPRWIIAELRAWLAAGCPDRETWDRLKATDREVRRG
jgi:predicted DNA-binding transcriptional regulator AlpA